MLGMRFKELEKVINSEALDKFHRATEALSELEEFYDENQGVSFTIQTRQRFEDLLLKVSQVENKGFDLFFPETRQEWS